MEQKIYDKKLEFFMSNNKQPTHLVITLSDHKKMCLIAMGHTGFTEAKYNGAKNHVYQNLIVIRSSDVKKGVIHVF